MNKIKITYTTDSTTFGIKRDGSLWIENKGGRWVPEDHENGDIVPDGVADFLIEQLEGAADDSLHSDAFSY